MVLPQPPLPPPLSSSSSPSRFIFFLKLILILSFLNLTSSQPGFPQNIETFYPPSSSPTPFPTPTPSSSPSPSLSPSPTIPILPSPPPPPPSSSNSSSTSRKSIITAVGVTAASTLLLVLFAFFIWTRCANHRTRRGTIFGRETDADEIGSSRFLPAIAPQTEFARFDGNVKGLIVDEDGLDILYWRKLEGSRKHSLRKEALLDRLSNKSSSKPPIPRGKSSSSSSNPTQIHPVNRGGGGGGGDFNRQQQERVQTDSSLAAQSMTQQAAMSLMVVPRERNNETLVSSPPPPSPPPPSLASSEYKTPNSSPPPPPPPPGKKSAAPPPPPPPRPGGAGPSKPPTAKQIGSKSVSAAGKSEEEDEGSVKLKPLHWEKVNINSTRSMVWDKIDNGSFQYNGDMMEALFGVVATNRKSPNRETKITEASSSSLSNPNAKIFILDPRKSQNTSIILKSLETPRDELISSLISGTDLHSETLEKLTRITPTQEEESSIMEFNGDPTNLADAEYFLYHLLKAVPDAFTRANAMLFKTNYDAEILGVKESLQTLESSCNELRSRGIFLKLLEAILKAGNRLNAGTARGDAKAFNLTTLLKLSDYKSSDGKTTLLHFVVHEVVRNEGKRNVLNRNSSNRGGYGSSATQSTAEGDDTVSKEEKEKEFLKLGLPVVGGLSAEFSEVKKAAGLDYNALDTTLTSLSRRVAETRQLVEGSNSSGEHGGGFLDEMKGFLAAAELELEQMKEEHTRVMDLVKKTTQYYQAGASNDKIPLQLFVIVKDFLGMVDRACVEIARSLQQQQIKKRPAQPGGGGGSSSSSSSSPEALRTRVTFPRLPDHFLSDKSSSNSEEAS